MFQKIKKNYFILITTFLIIYFFLNLLDGERGLISFFKKKNILIDLTNKQVLLINNIKETELKNSLLTNKLDLDFIETLIRKNFLLGRKSDKIYIIKDE
tara:strand:- start:171 stop:467 length:297 start_codon:yes stop_codon:yes gene_type:complete